MAKFTKNNSEIYSTTNNGTGQAIICIHGNSLSSKSFAKQLDAPILQKYSITAIDLPGHGNSQNAVNPSETYSFSGFAKEVAEFIKTKFNEPVILVGNSLGGYISIEIAAILPNIKGIVIFGTQPLGKPPEVEKAFLPNPIMALAFKGELNENEALEVCKGFIGPTNIIPKEFVEDILSVDKVMRTKLGESFVSENFVDEIEIVQNLKIPIAIFNGEKDEFLNYGYIENIAIPTLWQNKIHYIKNAYHAPQFEQPEIFNKLLNNFIEDIS